MNEYELKRQERILANQAILKSLGIPNVLHEIGEIISQEKPYKRPRKKRKKKQTTTDVQRPVRRSTRRGVPSSGPQDDEVESAEDRFNRELGVFIVNEECPKCGKLFTKGHKSHLKSCKGTKKSERQVQEEEEVEVELPREVLTEEEKKDAKKKLAARMRALELSGLDEVTADHASFQVLGSGKNRLYTVTLNDEKHSCQCMDYRFRRHNCKHICLVLNRLGILEQPQAAWRQAVERRLAELKALHEGGSTPIKEASVAPPHQDAAMAAKFL